MELLKKSVNYLKLYITPFIKIQSCRDWSYSLLKYFVLECIYIQIFRTQVLNIFKLKLKLVLSLNCSLICLVLYTWFVGFVRNFFLNFLFSDPITISLYGQICLIKTCVRYILFLHQMIALQKLWKKVYFI